MKLWQACKMAFATIFSNRMRSVLTMLGVIIGVFAVAVLVSIMQGASDSVTEQMQDLGSTQISASITGGRYSLSLSDLKEMEELEGVRGVSTTLSATMKTKNGATSHETTIDASTVSYALVQNRTMLTGRFLSARDIDNRASVAVLGTEVALELFGSVGEDVVGRELTVAGKPFTVIGVLEEKGTTILGNADDTVVIPISTGQRMMNSTEIRNLTVVAESDDLVPTAQLSLERYLDRKLGATHEDTEPYRIFAQSQILDSIGSITGMMTGLLAGIASISLLVGGIGIMNIMLVSVTERTREIGIRKAVGAKRRDILFQFLVEAVAITLLGGVVGLVLGDLGTRLIAALIDITARLTLGVVILSLGFSLAIGILFGLYPAAKAANLQPIDALRHD